MVVRHSVQDLIRETGRFVIDGSMGTALEDKGANLNNALWTAAILCNQPELVKEVHLDYFRAGADCGITCSYQATIPGLMKQGMSEDAAEELIVKSVEIFREARDEWWNNKEKDNRSYPLCLAGIGPYGAYLADGSEYRGNYGISDETLRDFHKRRMELLWNAGADILLLETQPSLHEVLIEAELAENMNADYWISFSCRDGVHINEGDKIEDAVRMISHDHPHLRMVGVNCTKPEYIVSLIHEIQKGTDLPIAVYPNSGKQYDPTTKTWHGVPDQLSFGEYALRYYEAGTTAVGGCCTTIAEDICDVKEARDRFCKTGSFQKIRNK